MTAVISDRVPPAVTLRIGGERRTKGASVFNHVSPVTGSVDAEIPLAGVADIDDAVAAAQEGFEIWRRTPGTERARKLFALAELIDANHEEFMRLGMLDNGTAVTTMVTMVPAASSWVRYYAGWADKVPQGRVNTTVMSEGELGYTLRQPYGVIGVIITWNAPLMSLCMKIPAALAAGNSVVVKPSEMTPFSAMLFADLAAQAGIPDGVINVVPGDAEAGSALVGHPDVKLITFTGGPITARKITAQCAETFKPVLLELGGKSANLIFDDANLDEAIPHAAFSSVAAMAGQGCAFPTRVLAQRGVYDQVVSGIAQAAKSYVVGDPFESTTTLGPVVNEAAVERITGMIDRAHLEGARLVAGGSRLGGELKNGCFISPTVFADVSPDSELAQVEVFGPVLAIIPFDTEEEAVAIANSTGYGLSGRIWTNETRRAMRVVEQMITGEVMVNDAKQASVLRPFGGVGHSGLGREGGVEGLEEFLWTKSVAFGGGPR